MSSQNPLNQDQTNWIKSTCAYCGVGCGIEASVSNASSDNASDNADAPPIVSVRGDESHPANFGRLCSKGLALGDTVSEDGKLLTPKINGEEATWDNALQHVADHFSKTIAKYGPDSVAFYVSGQLLTEDYYVANKLMKGFIGSSNIDTNSRLCMSSSVAGHKRAFGTDTVPNCYEDMELADMIVLTGSNLAWCHPVLFQRLKAAKQANPSMKIIVIDPRETDTCDIADLHLAIAPGADVALFNGLLSYLVDEGHTDQDYIEQYTQGFSEAIAAAKVDSGDNGIDYLQLSKTTGVPISYLETFYRWFAETSKVMTFYSQGVNQSSAGTDKVNSIINCHLATGRIGKEGAGPFSVTGQPNAMGGREVGGLANMLAAHMEFGNEDDHRAISEFWETDQLATGPGLKAVDMFEAVDSGKIKAIWIMATNPVVSMPDANKIKAALAKCPMVVVSDCIEDTDTTRCADVLLPAKGWAEKSGTVTNSERRISRQRALIATSNNASQGPKSDWWLMCQVALRMNFSGFNFTSEADVFREYCEMTALNNDGKRDLDLSGLQEISDSEYDELTPQQWPLPKGSKLDTSDNLSNKRFFAEGQFYTASGKANFLAVTHRPPASSISPQYPMVLNTGRIRDQWHTMTRTGIAPQLGSHKPEPYVQMNPQDAKCFLLSDGDIAELHNELGTVKARVVTTTEMNPGQVFMPIHWTDTQSSDGKVCRLINSDVDPFSGQPEAKYSAIAIRPWEFQHEAIVLSRVALDTSAFDYWVERRVDGGFVYHLAQAEKAEAHEQLPSLLEQYTAADDDSTYIAFTDASESRYRRATITQGELSQLYVAAPSLSGSDYSWLDKLLAREMDTDTQKSLLKGSPTEALMSGKQICACKQVGELTIINAIIQEGCDSAEAIGAVTEAGTGCGSCVPELNRILSENSTLGVAV